MVDFILLPMKKTPLFFSGGIMRHFGNAPLIFLVFFFCALTIVPCLAVSSDIHIAQVGSVMDWDDAHIDNNLIASYVSSSNPPAIKVYYTDGTFYQSIPLTNNSTELNSLEISDGRVYYTEYDTSELMYWRNETVYEFDLSTGEKQVIYVTEGPQQRVTKIVADGDHVVMRGGGGDRKLILYTRSTGSFSTIVTSHNSIHGLAIDGDRIMWGCERTDKEPGREIHIYTISTGEDHIIPESKSIRTFGYGDISGDNVVWVTSAEEPDDINGIPVTLKSYDIRLTNLISGKTRSIEISETAPMTIPRISGNILAWLKAPNIDYNNSCNSVIRTYDISTGKFTNFGSGICCLNDFDGDLLLRDRLWITSISGKIPVMKSPTSTLTITQSGICIPSIESPNTPVPESPVDPIIIVSAITAGVTGYVVFNKRR
jgi:archaellum component FlaG (FlaF/FlaG flagellin family)